MYGKRAAMPEDTLKISSQLRYELQSAHTTAFWQPLLDSSLCIRAQEVACFIAKQMCNSDLVHTIEEQTRQRSIYPMGWFPSSVAAGDVGIALLHDYIDTCFPGYGWEIYIRQYFNLAATGIQQVGFGSLSLYNGISGMALALSIASRGGKRYRKTLTNLHQGLCEQVLQRTWRRPGTDRGVADRDYDVISGAAGVLAYLISVEQPDERVQAATEHLLEYLTWLAEPGQPVGQERWYIPPSLSVTDLQRELTPQGHFNCGLAHGIPGPLAALALTWLAGYRYPGLRESIAYLAHWIEEHHVNAPWGMDWSDSIPLERASNPQDWQNLFPTRAAWCYGAPGVARSLWLAGQALDDEHISQIAVEAIEAVLRRPIVTRHLPSSHICHGVAGLLQICLRFASECESALVREHIPILTQQLLDAFNPDSAFGFSDMDEGKPLDKADWLTGAAGIAMVLLAASTSVEPTWDRALVIA